MPELSRNAQILRYLLERAPGLGHVKLVKFTYLADLESRRFLGKPISSFVYRKDHYGPFDLAFFKAEAELVDGGFAVASEVPVGPYVQKTLSPTPRAVEYAFTPGEAEVLQYVAATYMDVSARMLCDDVVYETEPMKAAKNLKSGERIPMDVVNRKGQDPLGFDLERMLQSEEQAKAGRTKPVSAVLDELRRRVH